jgi:hypothetical protein
MLLLECISLNLWMMLLLGKMQTEPAATSGGVGF